YPCQEQAAHSLRAAWLLEPRRGVEAHRAGRTGTARADAVRRQLSPARERGRAGRRRVRRALRVQGAHQPQGSRPQARRARRPSPFPTQEEEQGGKVAVDTRAKHLLLELYGCDSGRLNDAPLLADLMRKAVTASGARVVGETFHRYSPHGVTGVLVIE